MGLSVNTNIAALNAYRNLSNTQSSLSTSLEKLSSGLRINRAADDAAGLASPRVCARRSPASSRPSQRPGRHQRRPDG